MTIYGNETFGTSKQAGETVPGDGSDGAYDLTSCFQFCDEILSPSLRKGVPKEDTDTPSCCQHCISGQADTLKGPSPSLSASLSRDLEVLSRQLFGEMDADAASAVILGRLVAEALAPETS